MKLIERAYNASPENKNNAMVLNHLANHFIIRGELDKAYTLAFLAYQNTEVKKMRAESCFHIARTHHMKGQFEQVPPPSPSKRPRNRCTHAQKPLETGPRPLESTLKAVEKGNVERVRPLKKLLCTW